MRNPVDQSRIGNWHCILPFCAIQPVHLSIALGPEVCDAWVQLISNQKAAIGATRCLRYRVRRAFMTAVRPFQELLALGRIDEPLAGWRRSNAQFSASFL